MEVLSSKAIFDHIVTVKTKLREYVLLYKLFDYAQKRKSRGWNKKSVWLYTISNNLKKVKKVCLITENVYSIIRFFFNIRTSILGIDYRVVV